MVPSVFFNTALQSLTGHTTDLKISSNNIIIPLADTNNEILTLRSFSHDRHQRAGRGSLYRNDVHSLSGTPLLTISHRKGKCILRFRLYLELHECVSTANISIILRLTRHGHVRQGFHASLVIGYYCGTSEFGLAGFLVDVQGGSENVNTTLLYGAVAPDSILNA